KHFVLRTAWLYGAGGKNFVTTMIRLFQERDTVRVVDDQWGSPTYARDLAQAIVRIVQTRRGEYGTYHYTNEGKTSWCGFAREIYRVGQALGLCPRPVRIQPVSTLEYPTAAQRPQNSCLSKEKIKRVLGEQIRSWQEALEEFLNTLGGSS
ncbi:MAG: sugar nucleotide-binding protein, partial [Spirochaetales bacterium]|nr:sugar nucleotide-binding protein [Spirochaetales bacterium]